jgi:hypothetical protein
VLGNVASAQIDTVVDGNLLMENSTDTVGNILKGGVPFIHNFGTNNTFIGSNAGNLTMSGFGFNTAIGVNALSSNADGFGNTATGFIALQNNTSGADNTASGAAALGSNTTGNSNTASGHNALFKNTTGDVNTASGQGALFSNTSGSENTASGANALGSNTTGGFNTASGASALGSNTTGFENTAIGWGALRGNTRGQHNTAIGTLALQNNAGDVIFGNDNTAIGFNALQSNIVGFNNTAIGAGADVCCGSFFNATAIGFGAVANASNKIRLGNAFVTVVEGPSYSTVSDKTKKENFKPVDGEEVLKKIRHIPVNSWNYIGHDPKQFRHYGPVAQDFFAAFGDDGMGTIGTPTTIAYTDMAGILMIGVQTLTKELEMKTKLIDELSQRIEALERLVKAAQTARSEATK